MLGDKEIIKDLHSEEDVKYKVVVPYLKKLGYKENQIFFNVPIKAWLGRQSKVVYADLVVKEKNNSIIIVETKKPGIELNEIHKEQAISYARQFDPRAVPIVVVTNGISTKIYDVRTKKNLSDIPSKDELLSILTDIHISDEEKIEAGRFIIEGYKDVQDIKSALDKCHDIIRGNDGLDPISSFDEINKIIYTRIQEEKWSIKNKSKNRFTLEHIKSVPDSIKEINRIFQDASSMLGINRIFSEKDEIKLSKQTIISIVEILEKKSISLTKTDIIGLAYESFLPHIFRGERLGQFFTPDRIKEFMVDVIEPKIGDLIIDPAFGSGGFLVIMFKRLLNDIKSSNLGDKQKGQEKKKLCEEYLYGAEITERLSIASKTNMYLHGDGRNNLYRCDGLLNFDNINENKFDIVITNPPFGADIDKEDILNHFDLGIKRKKQASEVLFLERCVKLAKEGTGKIAIVLPESILMNTTYQYVRNWLDENVTINAIFKMPSFAFKPSGTSGISTSLVFMTRKKPRNKDYPIFLANVEKISFDQNNRPDLDYFPNILNCYKQFKLKNKKEFENKSCYVINRNDGDLLSVNFYKPKYMKIIKKIKRGKYLKLHDVCNDEKYSIVDGPFGTQLHVSDYKKEGVPLIRVKNIGINEFLGDDLVFISGDKHKEILRSQLKKDDVLIAKTGATFGKACVFPDKKLKNANMTASCCKISIDTKKANPHFIAALINSPSIHAQLERYSEKSAQPGFNLIELKKILIPDVPISKQNKIAEKILMSKKEIENLKHKIRNINNEIVKEFS